jgi:anaphase-promoting complex subunit 2
LLNLIHRCSIQDDYAVEFVRFKPDKRLRWLPLHGTVDVEIKLEDRIVAAEVPPLSAAFAELFSEKCTYSLMFMSPVPGLTSAARWSISELMERVNVKDKSTAITAIEPWLELSVLDEVEGEQHVYEVLECERPEGSRKAKRRAPGK